MVLASRDNRSSSENILLMLVCAELGKHFTRTLSVLSQILNIRGCTVAPKLIFRPKLWQERRLLSSCDRLACPCVCRSTHSPWSIADNFLLSLVTVLYSVCATLCHLTILTLRCNSTTKVCVIILSYIHRGIDLLISRGLRSLAFVLL